MTDPDELARALVDLVTALDALGRRWAIGGSLASGAYGEPRATNDVDVIVRLLPGDSRALRRALPSYFFVDEDTVEDAIRAHGSCNLLDERSYIKFDLFVPARGVLGSGQLDRARRVELVGGTVASVLGPEDIVLQKLHWFLLGGGTSDRQWRDILGVLARKDLDVTYLGDAAKEAGLSELLARALREA